MAKYVDPSTLSSDVLSVLEREGRIQDAQAPPLKISAGRGRTLLLKPYSFWTPDSAEDIFTPCLSVRPDFPLQQMPENSKEVLKFPNLYFMRCGKLWSM